MHPVADEFISRSVAATSCVGTQDTLRLREPNRYDRVGGDAVTRDVAKHPTGTTTVQVAVANSASPRILACICREAVER